MIDNIIRLSGLHLTRIQNIFMFGSRVYGNFSESSDYDILIVAKSSISEIELKKEEYNIHILSEDRFREGLTLNNIRNIECVMAPDFAKLKESILFDFKLDIKKFKNSILHRNSASWSKCNKKILSDDDYIGLKSGWHAMRIIMFASQIIKFGSIKDWNCANYIWSDMISKKLELGYDINDYYSDLNKSLVSEFLNNCKNFS